MSALATIVLLKLLFVLGGVAVSAYAVSSRSLSADSAEEPVVFSDSGDIEEKEVDETELAGSQVENNETNEDLASGAVENEAASSAIVQDHGTPKKEECPAVARQPSLSELGYFKSSAARTEAVKRKESAALQKAADKALVEAMRCRHGVYEEVFKRAADAQLVADKARHDFQDSKKESKIANDVFEKRDKVERAVKLNRAEQSRNETLKHITKKLLPGQRERRKERKQKEK